MAWRQHQDDASATGKSARVPRRRWAISWVVGLIAMNSLIDLLLGGVGLWQQTSTINGPVWLRPMASLGCFSVHTVIEQWQWWRVLTFQVVHAGVGDALPNLLALLIFGPMVEARLGTARFLAYFQCCALLPVLGHLILCTTGVPGFDVSWPLLGATGGSLGVLTAAGFILPSVRIMPWVAGHTMTLRSLAWVMSGLLASMVFATGQLMGLPAGQASHLLGIFAAMTLLPIMGELRRTRASSNAGRLPRINSADDPVPEACATPRWADRRRHRRIEDEEEQELDDVLDKIHQRGIESLSVRERRVLHQATMRMRESD